MILIYLFCFVVLRFILFVFNIIFFNNYMKASLDFFSFMLLNSLVKLCLAFNFSLCLLMRALFFPRPYFCCWPHWPWVSPSPLRTRTTMTSICLKRIFRRRVTWGQLITLFKPVKILFLHICARGWFILEQWTNFNCPVLWGWFWPVFFLRRGSKF